MAKARDGGSTSNSALKRALSAARRRNRHEPSEKRGFSRTISRKRSTSKREAWKDKLYSRCAPSIVVDVIEDLDKQQIELVKEMHFHGFISLKLHKLNKPFAAWLLSKFDTTSSQFFSGTNRVIKLTSEDICSVIGLSCTGKPIVTPTPQEVGDMKKHLCALFMKDSWDEITINFLQKIVTTKPDGPMTAEQILAFKTAFAIFVVTKFLAPQSLNNYISTKYIKAIVDIENIHKYNLGQFVVDDLRSAAATLQNKLYHRKGIGYITGCILIPQIFYLGKLDFGQDCPPDHILPRIGAYKDSMVEKFIKQDVVVKNRVPFPTYGKVKYRSLGNPKSTDTRRSHSPTHTTAVERIYNSLIDIPCPTFHLGFSSTQPESSTRDCNQKSRLPANLANEFAMVADQEVVPDAPIREKNAMLTGKSGCTSLNLSLKLRDIQQALKLDVILQHDTFNVAVQVLFEDEIPMFEGLDFLGWRHFLNQDLGMHAVAGDGHWDPEDHIYLFNDISIPFDVTQCRLIFVPLNLPYHYVLYAFDMEKKIIYILDPIRNPNKGGQDIAARHSKTKYQIAKALKECMKLAFPAWEEDIPSWHHEFSTNILATDNCMDSAFHVLHFMKNWDGNRLVNQASNDSRELRKAFLPNLLSFENNEVILSDAVSRYLQAIKRN